MSISFKLPDLGEIGHVDTRLLCVEDVVKVELEQRGLLLGESQEDENGWWFVEVHEQVYQDLMRNGWQIDVPVALNRRPA